MDWSAVFTGRAGMLATVEDPAVDGLPAGAAAAPAARQPVAPRHHALIARLEAEVSDDFIAGRSDIHGLLGILKYLNGDYGRLRSALVMRTLVDDPRYAGMTVRSAVVELFCQLRDEWDGDAETMTAHLVGIYRQIRDRVAQRQGGAPLLSDLRALPVGMLTRLARAVLPAFGSPELADLLVYTAGFAERSLGTFTRLRHAVGADARWSDAAGEPALRRMLEEPLADLPEGMRQAARQALVAKRIRSRFYRDVFLHYLAPDRLDALREPYATVLHWLEDIEGTAHLFPFMQGQTAGQKTWRLAQLTEKIVQLHEMYARVAMAGRQAAYGSALSGKSTRACLAVLSTDRFPPLRLTPALTLAALLCPFAVFVRWVQERNGAADFVLPPDALR